ncbi:MAG: hypothetical protein ACE14T_08750 [Syntrophales bacterium]
MGTKLIYKKPALYDLSGNEVCEGDFASSPPGCTNGQTNTSGCANGNRARPTCYNGNWARGTRCMNGAKIRPS